MMMRSLSLALAAVALSLPATSRALENPNLQGFEIGNGSFVENLLGSFGFRVPTGWDFRLVGARTQVRRTTSPTTVQLEVSRQANIESFQQMVDRNTSLGFTALDDNELGSYRAVEKLVQPRYGGGGRLEMRVFWAPREVVVVNVDNCRNCRAQSNYESIQESLDSFQVLPRPRN